MWNASTWFHFSVIAITTQSLIHTVWIHKTLNVKHTLKAWKKRCYEGDCVHISSFASLCLTLYTEYTYTPAVLSQICLHTYTITHDNGLCSLLTVSGFLCSFASTNYLGDSAHPGTSSPPMFSLMSSRFPQFELQVGKCKVSGINSTSIRKCKPEEEGALQFVLIYYSPQSFVCLGSWFVHVWMNTKLKIRLLAVLNKVL